MRRGRKEGLSPPPNRDRWRMEMKGGRKKTSPLLCRLEEEKEEPLLHPSYVCWTSPGLYDEKRLPSPLPHQRLADREETLPPVSVFGRNNKGWDRKIFPLYFSCIVIQADGGGRGAFFHSFLFSGPDILMMGENEKPLSLRR